MTDITKTLKRQTVEGKDQATPEPVLELLWKLVVEYRAHLKDNGDQRTGEAR